MTEQNRQPIEITEADLIERPANMPVKQDSPPGQSQGFSLKGIQDGIRQAKEMVDTLRELGIDLSRFGIGHPGGNTSQAGINPLQQIDLVKQLFISKYGDLTLNELIDKIRKDYGNKRITEL